MMIMLSLLLMGVNGWLVLVNIPDGGSKTAALFATVGFMFALYGLLYQIWGPL